MPSQIITKNSVTGSAVPTTSHIVRGELALNLTDGRIYSRDEGTTIVELGINPSTIAITAGTINNAVIGATTAVAGTFTNLTATGTLTGTLATDAQPNITSLGTIAALVAGTGQFATSLNVDGTATMDGLTVNGNPVINGTSPQLFLQTGAANTNWQIAAQENVADAFEISSGANDASAPNDTYTKRLVVQNNGDVSFYNSGGSAAKLFWDASAESLGIGTTSPSTTLEINSDTDNAAKLKVGRSNAETNCLEFGTTGGSSVINAIGNASVNATLIFNRSTTSVTSESMRIDGDGSVGIGTSNPTSAQGFSKVLKLEDSSDASIVVSGGLHEAEYAVSSGGGWFGTSTNIPQRFITNNTERMRIDASGNVGIGTGSPSEALHISSGGLLIDSNIPDAPASGTSGFIADYVSNATRFWSRGDATTRGSYEFKMLENDGGNQIDAMVIDSSGNVGIGTSSPNVVANYTGLTLNNATYGGFVDIENNGTHTFRLLSNTTASYIGTIAADPLVFNTNNTERMRIDSSGNVLVGTTDSFPGFNDTNIGTSITSTGRIFASAGDFSQFNRNSDGDIVRFAKSGATVGSIGVVGGDLAIYSTASSHSGLRFAINAYLPTNNAGTVVDATTDFGTGAYRYKDLYATNGTIQTSDAREKTAVRELTDAEMRVAKKLSKNIGFFQWLTAVEEKGADARSHCGQTVQGVIAEFEAEGLDAFDYAMVCYNSWEAEGDTEAGDRFSLRTDQLNHFMIRGLAQSQEELEARLSALEV